MAEKGKDGTTPAPFTFNSTGTFSVGAAPAGQGDLATEALSVKFNFFYLLLLFFIYYSLFNRIKLLIYH